MNLPLCLRESFSSSQLTVAFTRRNQSFPKIRTLSFDSKTCTGVLISMCLMLMGISFTIPKALTLVPFAVTITMFEGSLMV